MELQPKLATGYLGESNCYAIDVDSDTYYDVFTGEIRDKQETPVDEKGIVAHTLLAKLVLGTAPSGHYWGQERRKHHWQWPASLYPYQNDDLVNPYAFRELSVNKEKIPLSFERRLHIVTKNPVVPEREVMAQMIEADSAANLLFRTAREIVQWQKTVRRRRMFVSQNQYVLSRNNGVDIHGKAITRQYGRNFSRGFSQSLARYYDIPPDFRVAETGGSPHRVAVDLGRALGNNVLRQAMAA